MVYATEFQINLWPQAKLHGYGYRIHVSLSRLIQIRRYGIPPPQKKTARLLHNQVIANTDCSRAILLIFTVPCRPPCVAVWCRRVGAVNTRSMILALRQGHSTHSITPWAGGPASPAMQMMHDVTII